MNLPIREQVLDGNREHGVPAHGADLVHVSVVRQHKLARELLAIRRSMRRYLRPRAPRCVTRGLSPARISLARSNSS